MTYRTDDSSLVIDATAAGTGRYRARVARTGVQLYETGPEHRDASEVFAAESIATLLGVRVQVSHRPGSPAVGSVGMPFRRVDASDGNAYLEAQLEITDAATRKRIDAGELREISMGYSCEVVHGQQKNIRYDHLALLDSRTERARCGTECRVHFDSPGTHPQQQERFAVPLSHTTLADLVPRAYASGAPPASCGCRSDAAASVQARRDAFRASASHRAHMTDREVDIHLEMFDRADAQERADAIRPAVRLDHAPLTIEVPDSFFAGTDLRADAVASMLRRRLPSTNPSQAEIESCLTSIRLEALARADGAEHGDAHGDLSDDANFSARLARLAGAR